MFYISVPLFLIEKNCVSGPRRRWFRRFPSPRSRRRRRFFVFFLFIVIFFFSPTFSTVFEPKKSLRHRRTGQNAAPGAYPVELELSQAPSPEFRRNSSQHSSAVCARGSVDGVRLSRRQEGEDDGLRRRAEDGDRRVCGEHEGLEALSPHDARRSVRREGLCQGLARHRCKSFIFFFLSNGTIFLFYVSFFMSFI